MNCKEFLKELTDYLDGVIDQRLRADLEEHLIWCHDCHVVADTTKMTIEIYRNNEVYHLPDDLRSRLRDSVLQKCKADLAGRVERHDAAQPKHPPEKS